MGSRLKGDIIMSRLKLSGGLSSSNSVSFFLEKNGKGIEAMRKKDGTIVTREINSIKQSKAMSSLRKIIFISSMLREVEILLNLPKCLYHIPTIFWIVFFVTAIMLVLEDNETRMYHGAEHKVYHWYYKKKIEFDVESVKKCSRIHEFCGTNLLATIVTFQLFSSVCYIFFEFHIPEIITAMLPMYVYIFFPFNVLGLIAQIFTTATPNDEHITVALKALITLVKNESK